jgi:hypothetical protein
MPPSDYYQGETRAFSGEELESAGEIPAACVGLEYGPGRGFG